MKEMKLMVTLWPSFPHYPRFVGDDRLSGIRLNSAMIDYSTLGQELEGVDLTDPDNVTLHFDVKGRQLRIEEVHENPDNLEITLNHPIGVRTPTEVLFKAGEDSALLLDVKENGKRLVFQGGPNWTVKAGESIHIRDASLKVFGQQFTAAEMVKIEKVKKAGFKHYYLSYVENQRDVDEFVELVGRDSEVRLKIENKPGLRYVQNEFKKRDGLFLITARGDLYVEIDRPHQILNAMKLIIEKDPEASVGSRILLSQIQPLLADVRQALFYLDRNKDKQVSVEDIVDRLTEVHTPSCADFSELAWMYDLGYREVLLCDELCLKEKWLEAAIDAFDSFRSSYCRPAAGSFKPAAVPYHGKDAGGFKRFLSRIVA